jgi:hypothetical protein
MTKYILIAVSLLLIFSKLHSQEQIGLRTGVNAGILGGQLNPASIASSELTWDLNLISGGAHLRNNYTFLENSSLLNLGFKRPEFVLKEDVIDEPASNRQVVDFYDKGQIHNAKANGFIQLLSGFVKLKKMTLGFSIRDRFSFNGNDISSNLGYYAYQRLPIDSTINLTPTNLAGMQWTDVSVHIGMLLNSNRTSNTYIGFTPKFLTSSFGGYAQIDNGPQISKQVNNGIQVENGRLEMGLSEGENRSGIGFGLDVGIVIQTKNEGHQNFTFGASILDLGGINFNKNARKVEIDYQQIALILQDSSISVDDYLAQFEAIEDAADSNLVTSQDRFFIKTPTALSLQFDLQMSKKWFLNAMLIQGISLGSNQVKRTNVLAVSPRYESGLLTIQMPLSLADYKDLQVGLAARVGPISFGTEQLSSTLFNQKSLDSADFYVSLSLNSLLFSKNKKGVKCWNHGSNGTKKKH